MTARWPWEGGSHGGADGFMASQQLSCTMLVTCQPAPQAPSPEAETIVGFLCALLGIAHTCKHVCVRKNTYTCTYRHICINTYTYTGTYYIWHQYPHALHSTLRCPYIAPSLLVEAVCFPMAADVPKCIYSPAGRYLGCSNLCSHRQCCVKNAE